MASFDLAASLAAALPGVEASTKYDGSPVLKLHGAFLAGLATHPSAEPDTLIVRCALDDRARMIEDDPAAYYVTPHYRSHPVVLVRLSHIGVEALRELLTLSYRLTLPKANPAKGARKLPSHPLP
jgi:hypothetical protein